MARAVVLVDFEKEVNGERDFGTENEMGGELEVLDCRERNLFLGLGWNG